MEDKEFPQKKVLSLVLCVAVMLSVMVMGAGAAFSDQDKIENTEAVNMCTALNIIGGYPDGSYKPEGNIKRSEITKMICVALNGGKEPNVSTNTTPTFSDVRGTNAAWAEGYIESCVAQGIISGVGGGRFSPNGNVTGTQLAKMLLVSLGYNANTEGFVGNAWATNVNVIASQKGLYEGLESMDTSAALTRDNAAQMVWNAMNAYEVEYKTTIVTDENGKLETIVTVQDKVVGSNNDKITLLEDKYEAKTFTGTFDGNDKTISTLKDGQIQVEGMNNKTPSESVTAKFTYDFDLKYIGEEVSVLYKDSTNSGTRYQPDDNDTIYGVVVTGNTSVVNATVDDIDGDYNTAGKVSISDTSYKVAKEGKIVTNLVNVDTGAPWATQTAGVSDIEELSKANGDTVKFVLDDQNEIVSVYVTTTDLYKVTAVSGSKVSISGIGTIDTAENGTSVYDGVAKDDVVAVTKLYQDKPADATFVIEKAEAVSGTVTAYNAKTITLEGTVYDVYNEANYKSGLTDDAVTKLSSDDLDKEFTLYLVNGYVRAVQKGSEDMNNYAIVTDVNSGVLDSTFNEPKAELLFADGTKKTVVLHKDSTLYTTSSEHNDTAFTKTNKVDTALEKGEIVKYAEMSNGQYKIEEAVKAETYTATDTAANFYDKDTKALKGIVTDGNCPLFYTTADGEYKVANIRTLDDIDLSSGGKQTAYVTNDGKVVAAFVALAGKPSGASDDTLYGIITDDGQVTSKNGDPYTMFTVWTGEETTVYVEGDTVSSLNKGALVSFDKSADDTYDQSDFTILDGTNTAKGQAIAVSDYSEADQTITFANALKLEGGAYVEDGKTTKAIDEDAKIVYIDADNQTKGDDGMGITSFDGTTGYANALIVYEGGVATNKIVAIIVNTNSDTNVLGKTDVMGTKTVTAPGSVTMTNANGLTASAVADKQTAVKGEAITYTVTFSGTTTAATKVMFTAGSNSTVDTAKCVVTGNWVAQSATQANIATTKDGTGTVTFKVIANGSGSVGAPTIAVANQ